MRICILKESLTIGGNERSAANMSKLLADDNDVYMTLFNAQMLNIHMAASYMI